MKARIPKALDGSGYVQRDAGERIYIGTLLCVRKSKYIDPICEALEKERIPYYTDSAQQFFQGSYFSRFVQTLSMLSDLDKPKVYACWQGRVREESLSAGFRYLRRTAQRGGDR